MFLGGEGVQPLHPHLPFLLALLFITVYTSSMSVEQDILKLDVSGSDNLETVEEGIRRAQGVVDVGRLVIALAIYRIESDSLFIQAGFSNSMQYFRSASVRLGLSQPSIPQYRTIGYVYTKYRDQLEKEGLDSKDGILKLVFVPRALQIHKAPAVFQALARMSYRDFGEFASGISDADIQAPPVDGFSMSVTRFCFELGDSRVFSFDPEAPMEVKREVSSVLRDYYRIKSRGNVPLLVDIRDKGEQLAVRRFIRECRVNCSWRNKYLIQFFNCFFCGF